MLTKRKDGYYEKKITLSDGTVKHFYSHAKTEKSATTEINRKIAAYEKDVEKSYTFAAVADKWDTEYRERVSDLNYRTNTRAAYHRIVDYFGDDRITDITTADISRYINLLASQRYAKKTVKNYKSIINMIFKFAILHGYITTNPAEFVQLPHNLPESKRDMPTTAEIKRIEASCEGFDLLPYFLLYTGLRRSEALAVTYEDIDFDKKVIHVYKRLRHDGNIPVIEEKTKTSNAERDVLLLDRLAEKIPKNKKGLVFCNPDGTPLTKRQYHCRWAAWQKRLNVSVTAHQLRHAYATMLFEAGISVKDAQELMGHSDINLTRQIYTHIRDERKSETLEKLNRFDF